MELNTASAIISAYSRLEDQAVKFYEDLASNEKYAEDKETFLALAKENKKHKTMVVRAYREVITDALEACFSFDPPLQESNYGVRTELTADMSYSDILKIAMDLEEKIHRFCIDARKSCFGLLADIPQAFERVAKRKTHRKQTLKSLLDKATAKS